MAWKKRPSSQYKGSSGAGSDLITFGIVPVVADMQNFEGEE